MTSIFPKLALTTAGLAFGLAIADIPPLQAAIVNYTFDIAIDSGPLIPNTYSGTFSYNDATLAVTDLAFIKRVTILLQQLSLMETVSWA
jgi:hypothetical protein